MPPFTADDLARLAFLEGRWRGIGPDGRPFFEAYDFPDAATFRSRRFADDTFAAATDGSTVEVRDGALVARWGAFTWQAVAVGPDEACFAPLNAPSAFCWRRTGAATAEAVQEWTDAEGRPQRYVVPLERLP